MEGHHLLHSASSAGLDLCGGTQRAHRSGTEVLEYVGSRTGVMAGTLCTFWTDTLETSEYVSTQPSQAPGTPAPLARAPAAQVPARRMPTLGGTEACAQCLSPPPLPLLTLAAPALSGCARSGPHHERADEEGRSPICIAPSEGLETQTLLPCVASHHTARATRHHTTTRHDISSSRQISPTCPCCIRIHTHAHT